MTTTENNLGVQYANGKGVPQDYKEAVKWYRLAAEQGDAYAQSNLGWMYQNGHGMPQDDKEAVKWYRLAAEQGNANAQKNLGWMYGNGQGVPQDYKEAVKWYRLASEQGHAIAQNNLGWMYANGQGVTQDDGEAVRLFHQAVENGSNNGWGSLAYMYEHGRGGLAKDLKKALLFYERCGNAWANRQYKRLSRTLSCIETAKTELFGVKLLCTDRDEMMAAAKNAGAMVKNEDKDKWGDSYFTGNILNGSSTLYIGYTYDDIFAVAEYTFPSSMDVGQVTRIKDMIISKYDQPDSSSGTPNLGEVTYEWTLEDGIKLKVWRGWPSTTTYLTYTHPKNYLAMKAKQEKQRRKTKQEKYKAQSNAF